MFLPVPPYKSNRALFLYFGKLNIQNVKEHIFYGLKKVFVEFKLSLGFQKHLGF